MQHTCGKFVVLAVACGWSTRTYQGLRVLVNIHRHVLLLQRLTMWVEIEGGCKTSVDQLQMDSFNVLSAVICCAVH
jgi:hypothetical protein